MVPMVSKPTVWPGVQSRRLACSSRASPCLDGHRPWGKSRNAMTPGMSWDSLYSTACRCARTLSPIQRLGRTDVWVVSMTLLALGNHLSERALRRSLTSALSRVIGLYEAGSARGGCTLIDKSHNPLALRRRRSRGGGIFEVFAKCALEKRSHLGPKGG